jgi:hypothetical protein
MEHAAPRIVETDLGPVCNRCTSAAPPRLTCSACGRTFASALESARAAAQYAIAVYDRRRGAIRRGPEAAPG